jgi:hypothetical protein
MSTKKIKFHPAYPEFNVLRPVRAVTMLPKWFRQMRPVTPDKIVSVKRCIPFLDAMTSGYIIPLTGDVHYDSKAKYFTSDTKIELVTPHAKTQTAGVELPPEYDEQPWKWSNSFHIKTPKGYSTLFVPPLNREELPFKSFSGVVDTDKHPVVINFPFVIRKDFDGIIPAGTPLIQAIPFKRDNWKSEFDESNNAYRYQKDYEVMNSDRGWYKHKWWVKKKYE